MKGKILGALSVGKRPIWPFVQFEFTGAGREPVAELGGARREEVRDGYG